MDTILLGHGLITITWNGGKMYIVPDHNHPDRKKSNPLHSYNLSVAKLTDGTIITDWHCHKSSKIPTDFHLPSNYGYTEHYDYLKDLANETVRQKHIPNKIDTKQTSDNSHEGMIYNPVTDRWSWI